MQRDIWKFTYTAARLSEAAATKIAYHEERLSFWKQRRADVIETVRSEGIEVDEAIAVQYSHPKARDWEIGSEILVRNDLRKDIVECSKKLAYHTERRDTYDGWRQVLDANPEARLALDIDDWLFFFGRDVGREGK